AKEAVRAETINSLEVVGREWIEKNKGAWTLDHGKRILARLEKNIFPFLGGKAVDDIKAPELLDALRRIESRDAVYTAHRTLQTCGQIFRYAVATGRAERDISSDLKGALAPAKEVHFASITEPKAVGDLLRTINTYWGHPRIGIALRLAPYLLVRPGELRKAEWAEIDLDAAEWRIPASRMKMRVMHIVPLAGQVIKLLELLQQDTGSGRFLFPSFRAASAPISDATLLAALRNLGYSKDQMTVHGFRSMASTILNEQGYNRDWIERQLAHAESNSVRAAYNYAEYLPERRQMMQEWADYLDKLRENKD
ncbi:site-specific integrase, partial [Desulfococcaceae bacterium OttesenSCG-928-F15]|nr:site-specific integrase [Desulfococcaceae bacterium OttesenSCG-928-F15]